MTDAANEISAALARINAEHEEERQRELYRRALRVLRTIPSGTHDDDLTPKQRAAWRDHNEAVAWLESKLEEDA